jgi:hypothetical protein
VPIVKQTRPPRDRFLTIFLLFGIDFGSKSLGAAVGKVHRNLGTYGVNMFPVRMLQPKKDDESGDGAVQGWEDWLLVWDTAEYIGTEESKTFARRGLMSSGMPDGMSVVKKLLGLLLPRCGGSSIDLWNADERSPSYKGIAHLNSHVRSFRLTA